MAVQAPQDASEGDSSGCDGYGGKSRALPRLRMDQVHIASMDYTKVIVLGLENMDAVCPFVDCASIR